MTAAMALSRFRPGARTGWAIHLAALGAVWLAIAALFHADGAQIVAIWLNSSTFNHCLLIVPIIAWLVAQRLPGLREIDPAAWMPGLFIVALGAAFWLLGEAGGVAFARHLGLVVMLQGAVVACLGRTIARCLAFPIFYALFLVPAGEELVPLMQTITAGITTFLLALTGVPAHLEGIFITTPGGLFEVAEACAGVKFLIAMVALGTLVANVCFRSWKRRFAFIAVSILVPILANGIRAWGTIFIAQSAGVEFAAGFDHVVYGGIFFALVIALTLALGWRFFDRKADDPWFDPPSPSVKEGARPGLVAAAAVAIAAAPLLWSGALATPPVLPASHELPEVAGWSRIGAADDWRPNFSGADRIQLGRYRNAAGQEVDLAIVVFARQREGRELVGFGQGAVDSQRGWTWIGTTPAPADGRAEQIASQGVVREVVTFYRVGQVLTGSGMRVKAETMRSRLLGGPQHAVAVLVAARAPATGVDPRPAIDAFLADLGPVAVHADRAAGID